MAGAKQPGDVQSVEASARLESGLKSCRKLIDSYRFMLRRKKDAAGSEREPLG